MIERRRAAAVASLKAAQIISNERSCVLAKVTHWLADYGNRDVEIDHAQAPCATIAASPQSMSRAHVVTSAIDTTVGY